ncbi:hypothetical protein ABH926_010276 [Catenulispora sp. GP43]|uniref:hypothetical protein n=1 Tax=Catenulispora sp. GP43 TaxID=3156263 RepID=UPI00351898AE
MTDNPDLPILREHFRDVTRWVISEAVGEQLSAEQRDALAEEIAVILASGLAPVLHREAEHQAEKKIAGLQKGPVSFSYGHELLVDGFSVPDLVKLIDAVGALVDGGVDPAVSALHDTHRRMLYHAHDVWLAKHEQTAALPPDLHTG